MSKTRRNGGRDGWLDYFVIGAAMAVDLSGSFVLPYPFPRNRARSVNEALCADMANVGGDLGRAIEHQRGQKK
jgi:hypothetical protein